MSKMLSEFLCTQELLLEKIGGEEVSRPLLVIAFDEAHTLMPTRLKSWKPSTVLCKAISDFSQENTSCWVAFASTSPRVADFAVPRTTC